LVPPSADHGVRQSAKRRKIDPHEPHEHTHGVSAVAVEEGNKDLIGHGTGAGARARAEKGGSPSWDMSRASASGVRDDIMLGNEQQELKHREALAYEMSYPPPIRNPDRFATTPCVSRRKSHRLNPGM
jgi:hypothetical protein